MNKNLNKRFLMERKKIILFALLFGLGSLFIVNDVKAQSSYTKVANTSIKLDNDDMYNQYNILDHQSMSDTEKNENKAMVKSLLNEKLTAKNNVRIAEINWELYRRGYINELSPEEKDVITEAVSLYRWNNLLSEEEKLRYQNVDN